MHIVDVGIGFMLLLAGRPSYWIFIGGITYLVGSYYARQKIAFYWSWDNLLLALVFTLAGIALAYSFNRWAARAAGFVAGAYLLYGMPNLLGVQTENFSLLFYAAAGAAAVGLISISFDVGMALISSLVGATMILTNVQVTTLEEPLVFALLVGISIIAQYFLMLFLRPTPD